MLLQEINDLLENNKLLAKEVKEKKSEIKQMSEKGKSSRDKAAKDFLEESLVMDDEPISSCTMQDFTVANSGMFIIYLRGPKVHATPPHHVISSF